MQSRPFLVAMAAFVIVLISGAAIAGIGAPRELSFSAGATVDDKESTTSTTVEKPVTTTTTKAAEPAPDKETPKEEPKGEAEDDTKAEPKPDIKPVFTVTAPKDGDHVTSKVVTFGGEISDGYTVVRGKYTAKSHKGAWSIELVLSPGKNRVGFEAVNDEGKTLYAKVTVYYDAPADEKPAEEPKTEFTASQKYGSCGEAVPYDKFYGTAAPGTKIYVISEYGSGETKADANGKWYLRVDFPHSPAGKTFAVKVKTSTGEKAYFEFTNTQSEKDH
ncbi:MAG: hypothetical protein ABFR95_09220 [Actinomycetota bacterium]